MDVKPPEVPIQVKIPPALLEQFKGDIRFVFGHGSICIPVPDHLLSDALRKAMGKDFQVILTPVAR